MKKYMSKIIVISIICAFIFLIVWFFWYSSQYTEDKYELSEIESGIYAFHCRTVSTIPAHNYDVVTLCVNGNICTFKGEVIITYDENNHYAVIRQSNLVNSDEVYIYVPSGTVKYMESVGVK